MVDAVGVLAKAAFQKARGVTEATKTVSGATNATPIVITTSTSHGYVTGDRVFITGVTGNTAANGYWIVTVVDADEFSLNDSVGNGAYVSGGTSERLANYPEHPETTTLAAGDAVPFASESISKGLDRLSNPALIGAGITLPSEIVGIDVGGDVGGRFTYRGWERLVMCALGFEHPDDSPATLASGAYAHLFECDEALADAPWESGERAGGFDSEDLKVRHGVLGLAKQTSDWLWESVMVNKMTITGRPAGIDISFDLIGFDLAKGSYNSANWTLPAGSTAMCLFQQGVFKLGLRSGGAGNLDEYCPSMWELVVDNKLKTDDRSLYSAPNIVQPERSGFREVSWKMEFPRYYDDLETLYDLGEANQELAGFLVITGPQIASTGYYRKWSFFMSSMRYKTPVMSIDGPGPITHSFELDAHRPGGSDIFESGYYQSISLIKDSELIAMCQNEDTVDYITER